MTKNVFLTGATGSVGRALIPRLLHQGYQVTALVRRDAPELRRMGVRVVVGDVLRPESFSGALGEASCVVHLAGLLRGSAKNLSRVNVVGTQNVFDACRNARVRKIIYLSSLLVAGPQTTIPINETVVCSPNTRYGATKLSAENILLSAPDDLTAIILRCGQIITPSTRVIQWVVPWLRWRLPIMRIKNTIQLVHIDDVVHAVLLALENDRHSPDIFNIGDDVAITGDEFFHSLASAAQAPQPSYVPVSVAKGIALIFEGVSALTKTNPVLTRDMINAALTSHGADNKRAKTILHYHPSHPAVHGELRDLVLQGMAKPQNPPSH